MNISDVASAMFLISFAIGIFGAFYGYRQEKCAESAVMHGCLFLIASLGVCFSALVIGVSIYTLAN